MTQRHEETSNLDHALAAPLLPFGLSDASREELATPALVLDRPTLRANVRHMIRQAGGVDRLRPHVKTHKCPGVVRLMREEGVGAFKCATVAEADMLADAGATDILLAYPLTGPWPRLFAALSSLQPDVRFGTIADHIGVVEALSAAACSAGVAWDVYLDVDPGLHRTGVEPGHDAEATYRAMTESEGLRAVGFHVYDGHLRQHDPDERAAAIDEAFKPIYAMRDRLNEAGLAVPRIVAGGTGSFPIHAMAPDRVCSPGTCTLSDLRSQGEFADINYPPAAAVATRVVSKPGADRLTLDLGHKAIASEHPVDRRVGLVGPKHDGLLEMQVRLHSEEHLTITTPLADRYAVGDLMLGIPFHICPTSALHQHFVVLEDGRIVDRWPITARDRRLRI